jgi:response regulator NasT
VRLVRLSAACALLNAPSQPVLVLVWYVMANAKDGLPTSAANSPQGLRVLLIDERVRPTALLRDELTRMGCDDVGVIDSPTLIHDCVARLKPDVVIVDARSPSRDTLEHLAVMHANSPRPVVVFSDEPDTGAMQRAIAAGVSAYVVDGLTSRRVLPVLQVAIARFEQDSMLRSELRHARNQLAARKRIERAKGVLMAQGALDEQTAYARLRKMAMDRGLTLEEVSARIIAARELLDDV